MATATVVNSPARGSAHNPPHHALHMSTSMSCTWPCAQHNISTLRARARAALDHAYDAVRYTRRRRLRLLLGLQQPPPHAAEEERTARSAMT